MAKGLYESLSRGLDNLIKTAVTESVLNEKKQEISDEDQRDNELIRSAMKKRQNRFNAKLTPEEKDALARNNYSAEKRDFVTPNGYIEVDSYYSQPKITNKSVRRGYGDHTEMIFPSDDSVWDRETRTYSRVHHDANVNLANLGRKQKEREGNAIKNLKRKSVYGDWDTPKYVKERRDFFKPVRGAKKSYRGEDVTETDWRGRTTVRPFANLDTEGNFKNRLDAERYEQNKMLQQNYNKIKDGVDERNRLKKNRNEIYNNTDADREVYLKEIERYKNLLKDLDNREAEQVRNATAEIDNQTAEIRQKLDDIKASKRAKNRKSESLRRRRK